MSGLRPVGHRAGTGERGPSGSCPAPTAPSPLASGCTAWVSALLQSKQTPTGPGSNHQHRDGVGGSAPGSAPRPSPRGGSGGLPAREAHGKGGRPHSGPLVRTCSKGPLCRSAQAVRVTWGLAQESGEVGPRLGGARRPPSLVSMHGGGSTMGRGQLCKKRGNRITGKPRWGAEGDLSRLLVGEGQLASPSSKLCAWAGDGAAPQLKVHFLNSCVSSESPRPRARGPPLAAGEGPMQTPHPHSHRAPCWAGREGPGGPGPGRWGDQGRCSPSPSPGPLPPPPAGSAGPRGPWGAAGEGLQAWPGELRGGGWR